MKSQRTMLPSTMLLLAISIALPASASAQVMPIGRAPANGRVQPAACSSCDAGGMVGGYGATGCSGSGCGTVWGTRCMDCNFGPGLYSPCPNPCQTTLLTDIVCGVKGAVDTSLSHLFCCLLGGPTFPCGCEAACSCGAGCDSGDYVSDGYMTDHEHAGSIISGPVNGSSPTMASPASPMSSPQQPVPAPLNLQPNPFGDDPQSPAFQPIPSGSTSRNAPRVRSQAVTSRSRAISQRRAAPAAIRPVTHVEPIVNAKRTAERPVSNVATSTTAAGQTHYQPRRNTMLRTTTGKDLSKTPIQASASAPTLRFRDVDGQ